MEGFKRNIWEGFKINTILIYIMPIVWMIFLFIEGEESFVHKTLFIFSLVTLVLKLITA